MKVKENKIEFDLQELAPLLIANKTEGFRQVGEKILNAILEKEFEAFIGAGRHERNEERKDYRNSYKERQLKTTLGQLNLLRPYARSGKFETKLFENYSRIDKALVSMIVESYLKGVSTRKVEAVVSALDIELSHSTVSNLSHELDELVTEFKTSPLRSYYPYLYVDSLYLKVFNGSRFVSKAVMIAIGVNEEGYREILDIAPMESEAVSTYEDFFDGLKERGIKKVDLIISDGHKGIKKTASESFVGSSWQLCSVHFKRNLMKVVPQKDIKTILEEINVILHSKTMQDAIDYASGMASAYEISHPKLIKYLTKNLMDVLTFLAFLKAHHRKIHSTNVLERFNKEVKRRTKVVGAFPGDNSVLRLLVPLAVDTNAKWLDRKYVSWNNLVQSDEAEEEFTENF
ncbi:IS256 family transposase [Sulfurovum sp. NBC37-1]|uniref:IS256 family transposase n=1 Tax=Sulfurovum sp. (strain NBC37-1) TaxID=387093 RepID=UPI0001587CE1|nr:IS256 family transposase [Sulfurovum sp. NBC37-1]BAF72884.1 transposase [Sulfurovum sp. NBC37-1]